MTTVTLIRHATYPLLGNAIGGRADHELDAAGHAQAARLAEPLATREIGAILTSPVLRARQTAEPLAQLLGLLPRTEPDFSEIDFGAWTGLRFDTLRHDPAWQRWNDNRSLAATPAGETMLGVQARALRGLLRATAAHPAEAIAVFTHADVIKAILLHVIGAPVDALHRIEIAPASITTLAVDGSSARVLSVNLSP